MLTLEQAKAVNDGLHKADLKAALQPLEDAVDLRVNELPKLDKKAREALVNGLKNAGDAAIWADAIFHENISVRRFARKVFMGLGDEAAPVFAPLQARIERFWEEEPRLSGWENSRAAAARREQWEKIESALELLLRADPEKFMAFYAEHADNAPAPQTHDNYWETPEFLAWQERHQAAQEATNQEIERLLEAEWGSEYVRGKQRGKLPMRVELELDARARQTPAIAELWEAVGELAQGNAWQEVIPVWEPVAMLMEKWGDYLHDYKATGPTRRVAERVRPLLWSWIEVTFDASRDLVERERMVRRLEPHGGYWGGNAIREQRVREQLPALLLRAKAPLLPALEHYIKSCDERSRNEILTGEAAIAKYWMDLLARVGNAIFALSNNLSDEARAADFDVATLRALVADFPADIAEINHWSWTLNQFQGNLEDLERLQQGDAPAPEKVEAFDEPTSPRFKLNQPDALSPAQMQELFGDYADEEKYKTDLAKADMEIAQVEREIIALDEAERLRHLIEAPHPRAENLTIARQNYLRLWMRDLKRDEAIVLSGALMQRAKAPLWARFEAQLETYRRVEVEPIEPDVEQKLTEREAKEWRRDERALRREGIERDILDIANSLIGDGGLAARLKAIELADRPSCRGMRDQLEDGLATELDAYPGGYYYQILPFSSGFDEMPDAEPMALQTAWENWRLDDEWDAVLTLIEARLGRLKSEDWQRTNLERQLATGFYRRGNFAKFEHYATRPNAFPQAVAIAALALDDFEAWRVLVGVLPRWQDQPLSEFWDKQQDDAEKRARALEVVMQILAQTNSEDVARSLLEWIKPMASAEFEPHISEVENALESSVVPVKKWAMSVLGKLSNFDRERAAQTASEALWSENVGLAKDAAKFVAHMALTDETLAELAWESLDDATSLENIGVCEAVYRAMVKVKSKNRSLELSEAAREKLELLSSAQSERFGKFGAKLL